MDSQPNIPLHVAIIMDGNGRWARMKGLPKIMGHQAGIKAGEEAIDAAMELGVKFLTLYTFSTENWSRPRREILALMRLLRDSLYEETDELDEKNVRLTAIGRTDELLRASREALAWAMERTKE